MWRRLPLQLLRTAAAGSRRSHAPSRGGWSVPPAPAAPADLARRLPRRGYSRFASGFTPLEPKTLGSILDVERAKGLSPEHLVAAWDDYLQLQAVQVTNPHIVISLLFPHLRNSPYILTSPSSPSYPLPREKCAGPSCTNVYRYRDSKLKLPLCSLECYKAVRGNA